MNAYFPSDAQRYKDRLLRVLRYISLDEDRKDLGHSARYNTKKLFLKGQGARPLIEGEFHSATAIDAIVPGLVPKAAGWGQYDNGETRIYLFLGDFHNMDFSAAPEPDHFMSQIADLHRKGFSPNGMFGFPISTVCGKLERTVTWEKSWAKSFTHQLKDVIKYDNETNEPVDEWHDRNRLYSIHPYLNDSAGHPGSFSRQLAYNDILYLCEKYAPLDSLEKYDPEKNVSVTGAYVPFTMKQLE
ncbi:MAG: hypothetical protein Q9213_008248 [Squamulea squamosa]